MKSKLIDIVNEECYVCGGTGLLRGTKCRLCAGHGTLTLDTEQEDTDNLESVRKRTLLSDSGHLHRF